MGNYPKYVKFPKILPSYTNFTWKTSLNMYRSQKKNHTLLDQFYINLIQYSRYARTVLDSEKRRFLRDFLDEPALRMGESRSIVKAFAHSFQYRIKHNLPAISSKWHSSSPIEKPLPTDLHSTVLIIM